MSDKQSVNQTRRLLSLLGLTSIVAGIPACGGGGGASSGAGGISGTANIIGNVSSVNGIAALEPSRRSNILIAILNTFIPSAHAQAGSVDGINVSGGGQSTTTNGAGTFALAGVTPSANFMLTFGLQNGQSLNMEIGSVAAGTQVAVNNVTLNSAMGSASASTIDNGSAGTAGTSGSDGSSVDDGTSGEDDSSGDDDGTSGTSGTSGTDGTSGEDDSSGDDDGTSGSDGSSGSSGSSGSGGSSGS